MSTKDHCVFKDATTHQRGHTCWFDTAIVTVANTRSMRVLHDASDGSRGRFSKKRLSDEIFEHAGVSEYSDKLQKIISHSLGNDVCPMKPTEGQDILEFLKSLLDFMKIDHVVIKTRSVSNTPQITMGTNEHSCERIGMIDIDTYIEETLILALNKSKGTEDTGVLLVQTRGSDSTCFKLDCSQYMKISTPYGEYELSLSTMTVSDKGHVMSFGKCRSPKEWVVFDNEFTGSGYSSREFSAESFELVKEQMFKFPHTYFDPKHGPVPMNPFFKKGIRSSTIFVYDFVKRSD